jgi:hypothetical protein
MQHNKKKKNVVVARHKATQTTDATQHTNTTLLTTPRHENFLNVRRAAPAEINYTIWLA